MSPIKWANEVFLFLPSADSIDRNFTIDRSYCLQFYRDL